MSDGDYSDSDNGPTMTYTAKQVYYCPISSLPYELIEFLPSKLKKQCTENVIAKRAKLEKVGIDVENLGLNLNPEADAEPEEGKSQKRGGKAASLNSKALEKKAQSEAKQEVVQQVTVGQASLNKGKKKKTIVTGLETCGVTDLKKAAKAFAGQFACASSVTRDASKKEPSEIMIQYQGDIDAVCDFLESKLKISPDFIKNVGDIKPPGSKNKDDGEEAEQAGPSAPKKGGGKKKRKPR